MGECEHNYEYRGMVFSHSSRPIPGSGALARYYEDRYFCTKCLKIEDVNRSIDGNSYYDVKYGATPK